MLLAARKRFGKRAPGDHLGAHPTGGHRWRIFIRRTGSGQSDKGRFLILVTVELIDTSSIRFRELNFSLSWPEPRQIISEKSFCPLPPGDDISPPVPA